MTAKLTDRERWPVIQFPAAKDPLDFGGMGIKIDVEQQRKNWAETFTSVQLAARFCNLDHMKAEKAARAFIEDAIIDGMGSRWADTIEYLESVIAIMKAALGRLEVSESRALGWRRKTKPNSPASHPRSRKPSNATRPRKPR